MARITDRKVQGNDWQVPQSAANMQRNIASDLQKEWIRCELLNLKTFKSKVTATASKGHYSIFKDRWEKGKYDYTAPEKTERKQRLWQMNKTLYIIANKQEAQKSGNSKQISNSSLPDFFICSNLY